MAHVYLDRGDPAAARSEYAHAAKVWAEIGAAGAAPLRRLAPLRDVLALENPA